MPKIFSSEERERLRTSMLESGFELLKRYGMTHMSVDKIATSVGLGKSTFYNFFPSKERFVIDLMNYERSRIWGIVDDALDGRKRLTVSQGKALLRRVIFDTDSIYQYLTPEDAAKLMREAPDEFALDLAKETAVLKRLFSYMEGVRQSPNYALISNILKLAAMAAENRAALHESGYNDLQDLLFDELYGQVFEDEHSETNAASPLPHQRPRKADSHG